MAHKKGQGSSRNGRDSQVVWQGTAKNDQVPQFGTVILEAKTAK